MDNEASDKSAVGNEAASGPERAAGTGSAEADIIFEKKGSAGVITLDRPKALNALNDAMRRSFAPYMDRWAADPEIYGVIIRSAVEDAFCVGGDVRELCAGGRDGRGAASLAQEYALNWRLDRFTKPTISLINGMVMGSGVGITRFGTHRVAGENYSFAMPEAAIGFFPDVGATWFLAHMEDEIGTYLGLTGQRIERADAFALGLVSHSIASDRFAEIENAVSEADPIDPVLDDMHEDPGPGVLAGLRETIRASFSAPTVEEIIRRVEAVAGTHAAWRDETLSALGKNSPMSLKVTLRQMREGRRLDLRQALQLEYRLACRFLEGHDFYEGVRAHLIDKDRAPAWQPQMLSDVDDVMVAGYFAPLEEGELELAAERH